MKHYTTPTAIMCGYSNEDGKYRIFYEDGCFETGSEEVWLNQLHKMCGAPHHSLDIELLNKHVLKQVSFPLQHITLTLSYVVRPFSAFPMFCDETEQAHPSYYEVSAYSYLNREVVMRQVYYTREGADKFYKQACAIYQYNEFDIASFLN